MAGRSTRKAAGIGLNLLVWVQAAHTLDIAVPSTLALD
jgi:hypothetical protein